MVIDSQPISQTQCDLKLLLLGAPSVGKTTTLQKYAGSPQNIDTSTKNTCVTKQIVSGGKLVNLKVCEIADPLLEASDVEYAHGAIVMYDVTNTQSFHDAKDWVARLKAFLGGEKMCIVIAGNKVDLLGEQVPIAQVQEYVYEIEAKHYRISALQGINIEGLFKDTLQWTRQLIASGKIPQHFALESAVAPTYYSSLVRKPTQRSPQPQFCCCCDSGDGGGGHHSGWVGDSSGVNYSVGGGDYPGGGGDSGWGGDCSTGGGGDSGWGGDCSTGGGDYSGGGDCSTGGGDCSGGGCDSGGGGGGGCD